MPEPEQQSFDLGVPKEPPKKPNTKRRFKKEVEDPQRIIALKSPVYNEDEIKREAGTPGEKIKRIGIVVGRNGYLVDSVKKIVLRGDDGKPYDSGFVGFRALEDISLADEGQTFVLAKGLTACTFRGRIVRIK